MDENANVVIYDPQVEHEQIWMDLQEVSPKYTLQQSECHDIAINFASLHGLELKFWP